VFARCRSEMPAVYAREARSARCFLADPAQGR
jgi:hypothetical protein